MTKLKILVVEDNALVREIMAGNLEGQVVDFASDRAAAERKLKAGEYDICFLDLDLGDNDGYSGLKLIPLAVSKKAYPVVMSSCDTEETIGRAYELGCKEFYVKGNEQQNVAAIIARYMRDDGGKKAQAVFTENFVTNDPETRALVSEAIKYAPTELPLMLLGPSGTGKTTLAQLLHAHSGRDGDFVAINCAAYTEDLLEAELFGYKRGAFTGAHENRKGKLAQADNGTIFLDEIGAMSQNMQVKLLKAIEEKSFYPLGADKPEYSDFRVISATLEDVKKLLAEDKLRFDFFQRVHGLTLTLRPLAQRKCDIMPLVHAFTKGKKRLAFEPEAREYLLAHNWPGNARELKHFVDLIGAGAQGTVKLETVKRHITQVVTVERTTGAPVTQAQYDYALKHGLAAAADQFSAGVINRCIAENHGKKAAALGKLNISKTLLYATLERAQKTEENNGGR